MKQENELSLNGPAKVFIKLTLCGVALIGFAYASLLILGSAMKAIQ